MSIRFKLTVIAVAVILVANTLLSFVTMHYLSYVWLDEVQRRVQRNLNSARAAYRKQVDTTAAFLQAAALDGNLAAAVVQGDTARIRGALGRLHRSRPMDFITLLDSKGTVISRAAGDQGGDSLAEDPLVARLLAEPQVTEGTVIFSKERLEAEGGDLAERARFEVIETPAARPTRDKVRSEGMVLAAAAPVFDEAGNLLAVLYGGDLINRRYQMVDGIKREVFPDEVYRGKDIGTVTIFQGDLRISTNVTMEDGSRAVGTRLSAAVCEKVLDQGGQWSGPAFVVNDWYFTAYEPIRDPAAHVVGALYVGLLRAPFLHQRNVIFAIFLATVVAATLASLVLLFVANNLVLSPVRGVVAMAQRVIGGDLSARVGMRPPGEMGVLCRAIDSMAHAMAEREELLKQATQQQISRSEQLASVGRLAAGVAHEINNPLTGVLAFADLMLQKENMDDQDREDLQVIIRETKRARVIVRGLLDFARETPAMTTEVQVNDLLRQTLLLLGKRDAFENINIVDDLAEELPTVQVDKNQLQQVFVNLCLNACEAMPRGGTLMVSTSHADDKVVIKVVDTGCGIKREHLDQVFEPFFTTKPVGKGTGLGLSVSYGIIQQHGGTLEVESEVGRGTTFIVTLPVSTRIGEPIAAVAKEHAETA